MRERWNLDKTFMVVELSKTSAEHSAFRQLQLQLKKTDDHQSILALQSE